MNLERRLGLWDSISLVVGVTLGAGIFVVPGLVARELPSPTLVFAAWAFAGLLSFLGALVFAELGAMMPAPGGHYVFLREGMGGLTAFLCGWTYFLVIQPSANAYLATSFALYLSYLVPLTPALAKLVAVSLISVLCFVNYRGVRWGAAVQNFFTVAKLLGLAILIGSAFLASPVENPAIQSSFSASAFGVALIACLMSYEGWAYLSFVAGEVKDPARNLPRAAAIGLAICAAVYLTTNAAYLRVLTISELSASSWPGADLAQRTLGSAGAAIVTVTILCSIVGSTNGQILAPVRMYFAQALDRLFFPAFGKLHPKFNVPSTAILGVGLWSSVLALSGAWEFLINYAVFAMWVFATLVGVSLILLRRRRRPEATRPFRIPGYPVTAYLFVLIGLAFLANTLAERPKPALMALAIIAAGIPVFHVTLKRWTNSSAGAPSFPPSSTPST